MKILKQFGRWVKSFFVKVKETAEKYIPLSVTVVQAVKKAIESGKVDNIADILKLFLPPLGDDILDKVVTFLKKRLPEWAEKYETTVDKLNELTGNDWAEFTSGIAGDVAAHLGNTVNDGSYTVMSKDFYDNNFKTA